MRETCEVAPLGTFDRVALHSLGVDVERLENAAATKHRVAVARALAGVRTTATKRNPQGVSRGALIRRCSRQHAVKVGAAFDVQPVCCRQRPCPCCARARARRNAKTVTLAVQSRRALLGAHFLFATLTQVKFPCSRENPRAAVYRLHAAWRMLTNSKTAMGREFHRLFAGGLRTTETTWAARGDEREHGGTVRFDGYHAHLHILLEVNEGIDQGEASGWLQRAWMEVSPGSSPVAQVVRPAREEDTQQLCKYVSKPLEDVAERPAVLRELFSAIHGVRLLAAFGQWVGRKGERDGWRVMGGEDERKAAAGEEKRWVGPAIGVVMRYATTSLRPEGTTDRVAFVGRKPGDEVMVSCAEAWALIGVAVSERERKPPVVKWYATERRVKSRRVDAQSKRMLP